MKSVLYAAGIVAVAFGFIYYPHQPGTLPARLLDGYLQGQAQLVAVVLRVFDPTVAVQGNHILGRFPLLIVLDCAALDVLALFTGAVVAFPARWSRRGIGLLAGYLVITGANVVRIATLYYVGLHHPASFDVLHEELLQFLMVAVGVGAFAGWAWWSRRPHVNPVTEPAGA